MNWSDPNEAVIRVVDALTRAGVPHAVHGGLLLAAYGEPRETRDVDLVVASASCASVRSALEATGVATRVAFEGLDFGGVTVDRISLLGGDDDLGLNCLDLVRPRSARFAADVLARAVAATVAGHSLPVVAPGDFVLLKCLSTRPHDARDAASVLRGVPAWVDRDAIRREADRLAAEHPACDPRPNLARAERVADDPHGVERGA